MKNSKNILIKLICQRKNRPLANSQFHFLYWFCSSISLIGKGLLEIIFLNHYPLKGLEWFDVTCLRLVYDNVWLLYNSCFKLKTAL